MFDVACFVSSCAHLVVYVGFLYVIKCSRYASLFFSESHILFLLFTSLAFHIGLLVSSRTYSGLFIYLFLVFFFFSLVCIGFLSVTPFGKWAETHCVGQGWSCICAYPILCLSHMLGWQLGASVPLAAPAHLSQYSTPPPPPSLISS